MPIGRRLPSFASNAILFFAVAASLHTGTGQRIETLRAANKRASVKFDNFRGFFAMSIVEVLVLRNAMASSVAITFDALATANRLRANRDRPPAFEVRLAGSGASAYRDMWPGPTAPTDRPSDILIMPGLALSSEAEVTARLDLNDARQACRLLRETFQRGAELATSCSGVFLLAKAGLLEGRRATTSWWLAPVFRRIYPAVELDADALIVTDGSVTTAGAALAQMDLMLAIIARRSDAGLADECARHLLLDQRCSQSRYMALGYLASSDAAVTKARTWAKANLTREFGVDELAAAAGLSSRTFARRVKRATNLSPVRFLQRIRVERAIELLETSRTTLDAIAAQVGYAETSTLRRLIRRQEGKRPSDLRNAEPIAFS